MYLSAEFVNNLVAVLNVLASQVATALDTLNFALMTERGRPTDTVVTPRAPRNSRHGLRPRIITEHPSSDRSRSPTHTGVDRWTRHLPGTYRPCPRLERRIVMLVTTIRELGPNRCWIDYHLLVPLLLARYTVHENQDKRRLRHLIRILMGPYVRIQVPRRSGRRRRWSMVLVNFYKNLPLHFAMRTVNPSRHGHKVSWMKW